MINKILLTQELVDKLISEKNLRAKILDLQVLVMVLRDHLSHPEAECKTIGHAFFDPRKHCSICSKKYT